MRWQVAETDAALRDLDEAVAYVADVLSNPSAASGLLDRYEEAIGLLETMPLSRPLARDQHLACVGYRWVAVGGHLALFTVDEEARKVTVERVLHASRNWAGLLE